MKKIVILACQKANTVCTGAGCLKAFNQKTKSFARYQNEEIELEAFFAAMAVTSGTMGCRKSWSD